MIRYDHSVACLVCPLDATSGSEDSSHLGCRTPLIGRASQVHDSCARSGFTPCSGRVGKQRVKDTPVETQNKNQPGVFSPQPCINSVEQVCINLNWTLRGDTR